MTDWITDRLPTEADADEHGEVLAQFPSGFKPGEPWSCFASKPGEPWSCFARWKYVTTGTPWRHTSIWRSPTTTIPRKFTSLGYADGLYLALADDGTAWFDHGKGWMQLDPLPARKVEG